jgi:hypothetical protein
MPHERATLDDRFHETGIRWNWKHVGGFLV